MNARTKILQFDKNRSKSACELLNWTNHVLSAIQDTSHSIVSPTVKDQPVDQRFTQPLRLVT